jgi:DNA-binding TFAR19-related protein (PDSD5 family)
MTSFDLPTNYVEDLEALFRRTKAKLKKVLALESEDNQTRQSLTPVFEATTDKTLRKFSSPTTVNICTRPAINIGDNAFELKLALINMVQASQFCEKAHEDAMLISNTF